MLTSSQEQNESLVKQNLLRLTTCETWGCGGNAFTEDFFKGILAGINASFSENHGKIQTASLS